MSGLHAKLILQGSRGAVKEIRRVHLPEGATWAEFNSTAAALFSVAEFDVTYQDPEGDWITLSTDVEWHECVHLCQTASPSPLLRVALRMRRGVKRHAQRGTDEESEHPSEATNMPQGTRQQPPVWIQPVKFYDAVSSHIPSEERQQEIAATVTKLVEQFAAGSHCVAEWMRAAVNWIGDEVDVNVHHLAACLNRRAMQHFDQREFTEAFQLFEAADRLRPSTNSLYNVACCQAQLGQLAAALATLERVVARGYGDVMHIVSDEDLLPLHTLPAFHDLIARMSQPVATPAHTEEAVVVPAPITPESVAVAEPAVPSPTPEVVEDVKVEEVPEPAVAPHEEQEVAPEEAQEAAPATPVSVDAVVVEWAVPDFFRDAFDQLCGMGFTDRQRNIIALTTAGGRVMDAIDILLTSQ